MTTTKTMPNSDDARDLDAVGAAAEALIDAALDRGMRPAVVIAAIHGALMARAIELYGPAETAERCRQAARIIDSIHPPSGNA